MSVLDAMPHLFARGGGVRRTTTLSVANAFLALSGEGLVHMKAHKLTVLCDGILMGHHGHRLLDEAPEMWRLGPIMPRLYAELKGFGGHPIVGPAASRERSGQPPRDPRVRDAVAEAWRRYGGLNPTELSTLCHAELSPWKLTAADNDFSVRPGTTVDDRHTLTHFRDVVAHDGSGAVG